jgi:hypothetical protein
VSRVLSARHRRGVPHAVLSLLATAACGGTLDAGHDEPRGVLVVDDRNPIVLCNDGPSDNWQGEYAMLFAGTTGPPLAGIIVNGTGNWPDVDENWRGWQQMAAAARAAGLGDIPDPVASDAPALVRPSDGEIDSTIPNGSEGARLLVDLSTRLALPHRPLVVVTGGSLTEVADAYLLDHSLPERLVVISSLGALVDAGAEMGIPNGELDAWADRIVAERFRYVQVSAYYDQSADLPASVLDELASNAFTEWLRAKQPDVWTGDPRASDQVGVLAAAVPEFVTLSTRVAVSGESTDGFVLLSEAAEGTVQLVTGVDGAVPGRELQRRLTDAATFDAP